MYKLQPPTVLGVSNYVLRLSDNAFIPFDPANTDAQQFAKWIQEGNLPEPAEEGGTVTQEWATETISKLLPNG
jgi:hypothetical protein